MTVCIPVFGESDDLRLARVRFGTKIKGKRWVTRVKIRWVQKGANKQNNGLFGRRYNFCGLSKGGRLKLVFIFGEIEE